MNSQNDNLTFAEHIEDLCGQLESVVKGSQEHVELSERIKHVSSFMISAMTQKSN